jgi:NAD(P)-dependent dehydrogenase (short-subunit alcohol dehydrogenase family)
VLIAGAGGIGAACALAYASQGANVLVVDRDAARLDLLAKESDERQLAGDVHVDPADLTLPGAGAQVVAEAVDRLGGLDVLLHSVGVNDRRRVLEFTEGDWDQILRVNLSSAFVLGQAAGRHMTGQGSGHIVMVSSVSGLLAHDKHAPYAASKGGMNQLMRAMAREWAPSGVTVNAVAPGYVETNLTSAYLDQPGIRDGLTSLVPAGRLGVPEEVAAAVLFLSSDRAGFITGQVLYVDGGRTLV